MSQLIDQKFWFEAICHLPLQKALIAEQSTPVGTCLEIMQKAERGCLLVVDPLKKLCGIFTEQDVLRRYWGKGKPESTPIVELMTSYPKVISPNAAMHEAINMLIEGKFSHIPVCRDNQNFIGVLSERVLINFIAEHLPHAVLNLPPDRTIVSHKTEGG